MACDKCHDLRNVRKIDLPVHLAETIALVRDHINRAALVEVRDETDPIQRHNEPFSHISPEGPWPDHLSYDFACTRCNARFHLSAETYHGRGGEWRPLILDPPR